MNANKQERIETIARLVRTANDLYLDGILTRREWLRNIGIMQNRMTVENINWSDIQALVEAGM